MTSLRKLLLTVAAGLPLVLGVSLSAQQAVTPHIGYIFPAGGRIGTSFTAVVGGQFLREVTNVTISGEGIDARIIGYERPMTPSEANNLRTKLKELQEKRSAAFSGVTTNGQPRPTWTTADMNAVQEIRQKLLRFKPRLPNPAIAETVTLKITIPTNAEIGRREIRLATPLGLSAPLVFCVGRLPEFDKPATTVENDPQRVRRARNENQKAVATVEVRVSLPCVVNGQTLPGGEDRYRFYGHAGQHLVISAAARDLIPFLADAVPGWFQAVLSLSDSQGHELAYADHFRFEPDPVIYCEIPRDGEYYFQIRDSIYRGREDFIYRVTAGELPYITGIFPLGGKTGSKTSVHLTGWNLPNETVTEDCPSGRPEIRSVSATKKHDLNDRSFAVDALPELASQNGNHSESTAQSVSLPVLVNGCIQKPGQWDVFRFQGQAGEEIVAEVTARRLGSPLDSVLRLTDAQGRQIAFNDDCEDKGAGLQTQFADSYLRIKLPEDGSYGLHLGDAQQESGPDYSYRLRISEPEPDFALRIVPSSLTVRRGMAEPVTVYVLRKDGFSNEVNLALDDAPTGFILSGGTIRAGQDKVRFTLTGPVVNQNQIYKIKIQGRAQVSGKQIVRSAVPAEDMMQAFLYRHLVPSQEMAVWVLDRPQMRFPITLRDPMPVRIPAGGVAVIRVRTPGRGGNNNFKLELSEPPEGISIATISAEDGETKIVLHSDSAKIKPGAAGNLIVTLSSKRQRTNEKRNNQNAFVLGSLPAIPYEIVPAALVAK